MNNIYIHNLPSKYNIDLLPTYINNKDIIISYNNLNYNYEDAISLLNLKIKKNMMNYINNKENLDLDGYSDFVVDNIPNNDDHAKEEKDEFTVEFLPF